MDLKIEDPLVSHVAFALEKAEIRWMVHNKQRLFAAKSQIEREKLNLEIYEYMAKSALKIILPDSFA